MTARLILTDPELDAEALQALTRRLQQTINRETDFQAELPVQDAEAGTKGLAELIGQLNLRNIKSGVEGFINALRSILGPHESLKIEFQCPDGRAGKLEIQVRELGVNTRKLKEFMDLC